MRSSVTDRVYGECMVSGDSINGRICTFIIIEVHVHMYMCERFCLYCILKNYAATLKLF